MLDCPSATDIIDGGVTDHCCSLSLDVLNKLGLSERMVTLEAHVRAFPSGIVEGIFYGGADTHEMLGTRNVRMWSLKPCSRFLEKEPVLVLEGPAAELATIRPSITGALTFGTSLVTRASEFVTAAEGRPVFFFGQRKLHPAHVRQYIECAYVAGMEISATAQAQHVVPNLSISDCQEHYANLVADTPEMSWDAFLALPPSSGADFIVLDNLDDPVAETTKAIRTFGDRVKGVLVDTDSSRRGNIVSIIAEISWQLKLLNRTDVKICLTGGVTPELITKTKQKIASYGVGLGALLGAQFDFAIQVVAVDGTPKAKLGVKPGRKTIFACDQCNSRRVELHDASLLCCGSRMTSLLVDPAQWTSLKLQDIRSGMKRR